MTLTRAAAGLLLASLGCFMAFLALSRAYWLFLHPRFAWLTLAAGLLLALLGLLLALDGRRRVSLSACLALLVFLPLAWLAAIQAESGGFAPGIPGMSPATDPGPPTLRLDGTDYLRLNPAELLILTDKEGGPDGRALTTEGFVLRTPQMDAAGEVALVRLVINCCFADALAAGVRVRVADPAALTPGAWLRVAGRLAPAPGLSGPPPAVPGVIATVLAENGVFLAEVIEALPESEQPYVFEIRSEPPFAY